MNFFDCSNVTSFDGGQGTCANLYQFLCQIMGK